MKKEILIFCHERQEHLKPFMDLGKTRCAGSIQDKVPMWARSFEAPVGRPSGDGRHLDPGI